MELYVLDFETYYDKDYTLSSMTTEQYIRDPRFETIGVGVVCPRTGHRKWFEHHEFVKAAQRVNWAQTALLAHHAHFDGLILHHHYGITPGYWFDTLSMANAVHGPGIAKNLAALGERYGVGVKGKEVEDAKGKRRADFTQAEWLQYGVYCLNDCDPLAYGVFKAMLPQFSKVELEMIDITSTGAAPWSIARPGHGSSELLVDSLSIGSGKTYQRRNYHRRNHARRGT